MNDEQPIRVLKAPDAVGAPLRRLFAGARIAGHEVIRRVEEVQGALRSAQAEADRLVDDAREEAEAIRCEAREAGRAEAAREMLELLAAAQNTRAEARRGAEHEMLGLAFGLAERIVGRTIERDESVLADLVGETLRRVRGAPRVLIRVCPVDLRALQSHRRELAAHVEGVPITFEADAALEPGDCFVETDNERIDARLHVRLDTLRRAMETDP